MDFLINNSSGIYSIVNKINGKTYIGSTVDLCKRSKHHIYCLRNNRHHSPILQMSFNKNKEDNFEFSIIELVLDKSKLIEREQYWIDVLNPVYNTCKLVANTRLGVKASDETRFKIGKASLGRVISEKARLSTSLRFKGKKRSQEIKDKISESNKGKVRTEENKKKISDALTGRIMPQEVRQKIKDTYKIKPIWNKGKKMSDEFCKNISERQKGRTIPEKQRLKISASMKNVVRSEEAVMNMKMARPECGTSAKLVVNLETGIFYDSIKNAWESYGIQTLTSLGRKIRGIQKNNTSFRYALPENNIYAQLT